MSQTKQLEAMAKTKGFSSYQAYLRAMHQERYRGKKTDWNVPAPTKKKPANFIAEVYNNVPFHPIRYVADKVKGIL
jgi:hypothetical protein